MEIVITMAVSKVTAGAFVITKIMETVRDSRWIDLVEFHKQRAGGLDAQKFNDKLHK